MTPDNSPLGAESPEDWTPWLGGEQPLADHEIVAVWFRMGRSSLRAKPAWMWNWGHTGGGGDIIAYHAQSPRPSPEPGA